MLPFFWINKKQAAEILCAIWPIMVSCLSTCSNGVCLYRCLHPVYIRGFPSEKESKFPCKYGIPSLCLLLQTLPSSIGFEQPFAPLHELMYYVYMHDVITIGHDQTAKFKFANILVSRFSDKIAKFCYGISLAYYYYERMWPFTSRDIGLLANFLYFF